MPAAPLTIHDALSASSRVPLAQDRRSASLVEWACLLGLGVLAAAAAVFLRFNPGVPGHAILRTVPAAALGLALVPRHLSGSVVGITAFVAALGFQAAGMRAVGLPATTSLLLTGPLLDLAVAGAKPGWRLYARMALAGLAANLLALASRPTLVLLGLPAAGGRSETLGWLTVASYVACGLAAGLLSAACLFRLRPRTKVEERAGEVEG